MRVKLWGDGNQQVWIHEDHVHWLLDNFQIATKEEETRNLLAVLSILESVAVFAAALMEEQPIEMVGLGEGLMRPTLIRTGNVVANLEHHGPSSAILDIAGRLFSLSGASLGAIAMVAGECRNRIISHFMSPAVSVSNTDVN